MEVVALIVVAGILLVGLSYLGSPTFKGQEGERRVRSGLSRFLNPDEYRTLDDLTLPSRGGTTQIDHVVVSRFGVFVIETKNMKGWIFGDAEQSQWTQVIYGKKSRMQNPLRQNFKHVKAVQDLTGLSKDDVHNLVVFVGSAVPKTRMPSGVSWSVRELASEIRSHRTTVLSEDEVVRVTAALSADAFQTTAAVKRAHVKGVTRVLASRAEGCPKCGSETVKRLNKKTGNHFLGCSRYPKCRGTRPLSIKQ